MADSTIAKNTEAYVRDLLSKQLTKDHLYHDLPHTLAVRDACLDIASKQNISPAELEILEIACLLHDTGYTEVYTGHEANSHRIALDFLNSQNYPPDKIQQVLACIDVTTPAAHPANLLQQIIKDADYSHLAYENYLEAIETLRYEWSVFLHKNYDDADWYKLNYDFVKNHQYFTPGARSLYDAQKEANLKQLKKIVKKGKKKDKQASPGTELGISDSRSAQMMFKTALRNHLDLSNLADNKANIMLSVNALIITVAIPMAASYIQKIPYLVYPIATLLATCITSMVFATLATRPIRMTGYTSSEQIEGGESNLFFFGNFYKMNFKTYQDGMQHVITNNENLDNSIMRDLYFLGRSLGKKYNQLRICYNIFMFGMVFTVLVFGICYAAWR